MFSLIQVQLNHLIVKPTEWNRFPYLKDVFRFSNVVEYIHIQLIQWKYSRGYKYRAVVKKMLEFSPIFTMV